MDFIESRAKRIPVNGTIFKKGIGEKVNSKGKGIEDE